MFKVITYPFLVAWKLFQLVPFVVLLALCCVFQAKDVKYNWKLG